LCRLSLRFGVPTFELRQWPAGEIDLWRVWESENGPVYSPEFDRTQRAIGLTMFAASHGVNGAQVTDYLPPWQQPKRREAITDEEIIKAVETFNRASKKCQ